MHLIKTCNLLICITEKGSQGRAHEVIMNLFLTDCCVLEKNAWRVGAFSSKELKGRLLQFLCLSIFLPPSHRDPYGFGDSRDTRRDRSPIRGSPRREPRDGRNGRDARDGRDMRDPRDLRDHRDSRDIRDHRDSRSMRDARDMRDLRDFRDLRETRNFRDHRDPMYDRYREMRDSRDPMYR